MAAKRIVSRPDIMSDKPCFEGTRIAVDLIREPVAAGYTIDDIIDGYPRLSPADIESARTYLRPPTPRI